ncbi:MAG: succinate dehydrogenase cytochrome b subunit [Bacteroidales bacterium]|nr:succinate dehydrogenase cytochrome b subunit [Bacteroidales bacterium]MBR6844519.1 succinate dehydrogenase cytochrome b subunit [Bacteroidales bacterium]
MNIPKVQSISKKILVALLGAFLLVFLLFHAAANLLILRHDDGAWYSAFCHFMGTNWIVKVFEIALLGCFLLHIIMTIWLAITNKRARPVNYHKPQRSKTHTTSKLMILSGILIFLCLLMHFADFYFVKIGIMKGEYMVKTEKLASEEVMGLVNYAQQMGMTPEEFIDEMESEAMMYAGENGDASEVTEFIEGMRDKLGVINIVQRAQEEGNVSADGKWIRHLTYDERQTLRKALPESDPEPDFYYMAREKFSHWHIVLGYLVFFFVVFLHLRHAFPSAFQTLGLNNYKYNGIIEVLGKIYTWVVVLMFTVVPILVYLGL